MIFSGYQPPPAKVATHPNRVLIWIDGHIPSRVIGFFLTDWIQENALSHAQDDLGAGREVEITQLFWKTELEVKGNARGRGLPEVLDY